MTGSSNAALLEGVPEYAALCLLLGLAALGVAVVFYRKRAAGDEPLRQGLGSRIALAVGDRFAPSDRFAGFVHGESGASIILMELPYQAFDQLQQLGSASETFAAQGVQGISQLTLPHRSGDYIYLRGAQTTALVDYVKYILIFRDNAATGMVTANIPRAALAAGIITGAELEKIFDSARIEAKLSEQPRLFTLDYLGPFQEDQSLLGTTKGYRLKAGAVDIPNGLQPLFLVAPSLTQAPIPNLAFFAERSFDGVDQVRDKVAESTKTVVVGGRAGAEIFGHGIDAASGEAVLIYQLIVEARGGGYFRLLGLAPLRDQDFFLSEFRKIGESLRPATEPVPTA